MSTQQVESHELPDTQRRAVSKEEQQPAAMEQQPAGGEEPTTAAVKRPRGRSWADVAKVEPEPEVQQRYEAKQREKEARESAPPPPKTIEQALREQHDRARRESAERARELREAEFERRLGFNDEEEEEQARFRQYAPVRARTNEDVRAAREQTIAYEEGRGEYAEEEEAAQAEEFGGQPESERIEDYQRRRRVALEDHKRLEDQERKEQIQNKDNQNRRFILARKLSADLAKARKMQERLQGKELSESEMNRIDERSRKIIQAPAAAGSARKQKKQAKKKAKRSLQKQKPMEQEGPKKEKGKEKEQKQEQPPVAEVRGLGEEFVEETRATREGPSKKEQKERQREIQETQRLEEEERQRRLKDKQGERKVEKVSHYVAKIFAEDQQKQHQRSQPGPSFGANVQQLEEEERQFRMKDQSYEKPREKSAHQLAKAVKQEVLAEPSQEQKRADFENLSKMEEQERQFRLKDTKFEKQREQLAHMVAQSFKEGRQQQQQLAGPSAAQESNVDQLEERERQSRMKDKNYEKAREETAHHLAQAVKEEVLSENPEAKRKETQQVVQQEERERQERIKNQKSEKQREKVAHKLADAIKHEVLDNPSSENRESSNQELNRQEEKERLERIHNRKFEKKREQIAHKVAEVFKHDAQGEPSKQELEESTRYAVQEEEKERQYREADKGFEQQRERTAHRVAEVMKHEANMVTWEPEVHSKAFQEQKQHELQKTRQLEERERSARLEDRHLETQRKQTAHKLARTVEKEKENINKRRGPIQERYAEMISFERPKAQHPKQQPHHGRPATRQPEPIGTGGQQKEKRPREAYIHVQESEPKEPFRISSAAHKQVKEEEQIVEPSEHMNIKLPKMDVSIDIGEAPVRPLKHD